MHITRNQETGRAGNFPSHVKLLIRMNNSEVVQELIGNTDLYLLYY